jgi:hypothetical protein
VPDELITVSAGRLLSQIREGLGSAQSDLGRVLGLIGPLLRPPPGSPAASWQTTVAEVEALLSKVRGDVHGALNALTALEAVPRDAAAAPDRLTDGKGRADEAARSAGEPSLSLGASTTTRRRMSEIGESLKLTDEQTLERCVATQYYVDSKLRERWQFFIKRGRERRAVSFPGRFGE